MSTLTQDPHEGDPIPNVPEEVSMAAIYTKYPDNPLLVIERCDRCGSQAYGMATMGTSVLLFCGHHLNKYLDRLMEQADTIDDFTDALQDTGMTSANAI